MEMRRGAKVQCSWMAIARLHRGDFNFVINLSRDAGHGTVQFISTRSAHAPPVTLRRYALPAWAPWIDGAALS